MIRRLLALPVERPRTTIGAVLAVTLALLALRPSIQFDASLESFFEPDDVRLTRVSDVLDQFGSSVPIVLALEAHDVFDPEVLRLVDRLTRKMRDVEYVDRIASLTAVDVVRGGEDGIEVAPLVDELPRTAEEARAIRERALADPTLVGNVVSADGTVTAIVVELVYIGGKDDEYPPWVVGEFEKILAAEDLSALESVHMTGMAPIFSAIRDAILRDTLVLSVIPAVLIFVGLQFVFRNLVATLLPITVIGFTGLWTVLAMGIAGKPLTMATTLLPPLLFVIGMADAVHFLNQYYRAHLEEPDRVRALRTALRRVAVPCVMTSVTTMLGFLSLRVSPLVPIQDFGLFAAFGIAVALVLTLSLVPAALRLAGDPAPERLREYESGRFATVLDAVSNGVAKHRIAIVAVTAVATVVVLAGVPRIRVESHVRTYFKASSVVAQGIDFVQDHLAGTDILVLVVSTDEPGGVKDPAVLRFAEQVERRLEERAAIDRVEGVPDVVRRMNRVLHADDPTFERIPDTRDEVAQFLLLYEMGSPERLAAAMNGDATALKLVARTRAVSSADATAVIRDVEGFLAEHTPDGVRVEVTGPVHLLSEMEAGLVRSQIKSFAFAFVMIFVAMLVMLRAPALAMLSMVPNVLPVVAALGVMGWAGIRLDSFTVMIASIAIGIAVDDTIHYLHRFREEHHETGDLRVAMDRTIHSTGRAIVATSVILVCGFLVTVFSSFKPPIYFGVLSSLTVVVALLADVLVLPALLLILRPRVDPPETGAG